MRPQREALTRGVDVLVATPGRLLDHIGERNVVLDGVEMFVLDEADQMLDMGFIRPIRQIVAKLSARRQSLFFSATMPKEIGHLAGELLRDPVKVSVTPSATTVERVRQHVYLVDARAKRSLLVELFANPELTRTLVFTRTKRGADRVAQHLAASGISVAAIHGNKSQNQREAALAHSRCRRSGCWSPPTWPRAASTSISSPTSSTTSCRTFRRATCTASAARRAPARKVSPSRSATRRSATTCATSSA